MPRNGTNHPMPDLPEQRVHIVDDDEDARHSLARLLQGSGYVTHTYATAEEFLDVLASVGPGSLILDIGMPGPDGPRVQKELVRRGFDLPVIMVTARGDIALAVRSMKAGAVDFIEKPFAPEDILHSVADASARLRGDRQRREATRQAVERIDSLTPRERDVLRLLVGGQPNKMIATALGISPRTVEIHRANLMEKLGCRSLAEAVRMTITAGLA